MSAQVSLSSRYFSKNMYLISSFYKLNIEVCIYGCHVVKQTVNIVLQPVFTNLHNNFLHYSLADLFHLGPLLKYCRMSSSWICFMTPALCTHTLPKVKPLFNECSSCWAVRSFKYQTHHSASLIHWWTGRPELSITWWIFNFRTFCLILQFESLLPFDSPS